MVMDLYNLALQSEGLRGAQVLLTYDDMAHIQRRTNLRNTLQTLLSWDIVPILNENDTVATDEIKFGDNDSLSARVAVHMKAERLVILTDVDGLYTANPTEEPDAELISHLKGVPKKLLQQPGLRGGSLRGTGGMYSKLLAAQTATRKKIDTYLVKGDASSVLLELARGRAVGTYVEA
jgi:glutamate 5-kinase